MRWPLFMMAAALWLAGCSSGDRSAEAVPRPVAYPRVTELNNTYLYADSVALRFMINTGTHLSVKTPYWFDIQYPDYGATVFVTITETTADSVPMVLANRRERVMLNLGDLSEVEVGKCQSSEFTSLIYRSQSVRATPLQFISTDSCSTVVSGTVFFSGVSPDASVDSLAPMVKRIETDLWYSLYDLSKR